MWPRAACGKCVPGAWKKQASSMNSASSPGPHRMSPAATLPLPACLRIGMAERLVHMSCYETRKTANFRLNLGSQTKQKQGPRKKRFFEPRNASFGPGLHPADPANTRGNTPKSHATAVRDAILQKVKTRNKVNL